MNVGCFLCSVHDLGPCVYEWLGSSQVRSDGSTVSGMGFIDVRWASERLTSSVKEKYLSFFG